MDDYLNEQSKDMLKIAKENLDKYKNATPFPSIHFENFFNPKVLATILDEFPDLSKKKATQYRNEKEKKLAGKGELFFGNETKKIIHFLNSEPFWNSFRC